jgi:tetratricopeptide (TPR) repeat protein
MTGDVDPTLRDMDPVALGREQVWAFARLVREKSAGHPLLLIIDDMHRSADRPLEMTTEVAARSGDVAMLVLLVGRSDPGEWLSKFPDATTLRLRALGSADAASLAGAFVCDKPLAAEAADFLVERAGGNPLYLRELVAMARAQGTLVDDGGCYRLGDHAAIPVSLHALLAARLDGLPPAHKLVFEHVAVLGEGPTAAEVEALGAPGVAAALGALVDGGLLRLRPDGRYGTPDSMLREVAYETLPRHVRGELHRTASGVVSRAEERARHLERAADHLGDDQAVVAEAAEALADVGLELRAASRYLDALRVLERAVALGCRRPAVLLDLARVQVQANRDDDAGRTLEMIVDDHLDPSVAVERDHLLSNGKTFTDPDAAVPALEDVARRWEILGCPSKQAWALANAGVALFNLSRMREAAARLSDAVGLFEAVGDRSGRVAASSFLCLASPTDPRVPGWLADALEFADESGDRSMQMTTLVTLAWHHFLRSWWGSRADTERAEGFARRLTAIAEELGSGDMAVQGLSLLALTARNAGRFDEAAGHVAAIEHHAVSVRRGEPWLGWAAGFSVTVAYGTPGAAPPFPPDSSDPVVTMAGLVVGAELVLAGRLDEALARFGGPTQASQWTVSHLTGILHAVALVLAGRSEEARPWAVRAAEAAAALGAEHVVRAAGALMAEIDRDYRRLDPAPSAAGGIADVLVLRAHALAGDAASATALVEAVEALSLPGLAAHVDRVAV